MTRHEVKCVRKQDRYNPHERILGLGGVNPGGERWYCTQEDAVTWIEIRRYNFFVRISGKEVNLIVAESRYGNKYVKTEADGEQPNNLLSLQECPR